MTNQEQPAAESTPPVQISSSGAARRRFARAGLGATAALVTISSKAGMAADACGCAAPSGSMSGNLSRTGGSTVACEGRSPGYWKNQKSWPCHRSLKYGAVFSCAGNSKYNACSMSDMLVPKQWDRHGLGRHMVATYLNIRSGKIGFLTVPALQSIWQDLSGRGVFHPTPGVNWYVEDVVDYLKGTMA